MPEGRRDIFQVKDRHQEEPLRYPDVLGVGIGKKVRGGKTLEGPYIKVYVQRKKPKDQLLPDQVRLKGLKPTWRRWSRRPPWEPAYSPGRRRDEDEKEGREGGSEAGRGFLIEAGPAWRL